MTAVDSIILVGKLGRVGRGSLEGAGIRKLAGPIAVARRSAVPSVIAFGSAAALFPAAKVDARNLP